MFCTNCGEKHEVGQHVCLKCGKLLGEAPQQTVYAEDDRSNVGLNILAFLIPIVGLIMWAIMNKKTPIKAKNIGMWALIGWGVGIAFNILPLLFM